MDYRIEQVDGHRPLRYIQSIHESPEHRNPAIDLLSFTLDLLGVGRDRLHENKVTADSANPAQTRAPAQSLSSIVQVPKSKRLS